MQGCDYCRKLNEYLVLAGYVFFSGLFSNFTLHEMKSKKAFYCVYLPLKMIMSFIMSQIQ